LERLGLALRPRLARRPLITPVIESCRDDTAKNHFTSHRANKLT
jgi:hypothetical protein